MSFTPPRNEIAAANVPEVCQLLRTKNAKWSYVPKRLHSPMKSGMYLFSDVRWVVKDLSEHLVR